MRTTWRNHTCHTQKPLWQSTSWWVRCSIGCLVAPKGWGALCISPGSKYTKGYRNHRRVQDKICCSHIWNTAPSILKRTDILHLYDCSKVSCEKHIIEKKHGQMWLDAQAESVEITLEKHNISSYPPQIWELMKHLSLFAFYWFLSPRCWWQIYLNSQCQTRPWSALCVLSRISGITTIHEKQSPGN